MVNNYLTPVNKDQVLAVVNQCLAKADKWDMVWECSKSLKNLRNLLKWRILVWTCLRIINLVKWTKWGRINKKEKWVDKWVTWVTWAIWWTWWIWEWCNNLLNKWINKWWIFRRCLWTWIWIKRTTTILILCQIWIWRKHLKTKVLLYHF